MATPPLTAIAGTDIQKKNESASAYERKDVSNSFLIKWMFGFVAPVKLASAMACLWTALGVGSEVAMSWQFAQLINSIAALNAGSYAGSFWSWLSASAAEFGCEVRA